MKTLLQLCADGYHGACQAEGEVPSKCSCQCHEMTAIGLLDKLFYAGANMLPELVALTTQNLFAGSLANQDVESVFEVCVDGKKFLVSAIRKG